MDIKKENSEFYSKYNDLVTNNIFQPFFLEKELFQKVKNWHSTSNKFELPILTLDHFFNEENVKSRLLKDTYIHKNPSIMNYHLIDFIITILITRSNRPQKARCLWQRISNPYEDHGHSSCLQHNRLFGTLRHEHHQSDLQGS